MFIDDEIYIFVDILFVVFVAFVQISIQEEIVVVNVLKIIMNYFVTIDYNFE